jgi:hypothetical protein
MSRWCISSSVALIVDCLRQARQSPLHGLSHILAMCAAAGISNAAPRTDKSPRQQLRRPT